MTNTPKQTMLQLGYVGLVPYVFCLILMIADLQVFQLTGEKMFVAYSAVILSFLSGVLWGNAIDHFSNKLSRSALLLSNLFALIAWGVLLQSESQSKYAIIMLAFGFIAVWFSEKTIRQVEHEESPKGYQTMRGRLTFGVVAMHGIALIV